MLTPYSLGSQLLLLCADDTQAGSLQFVKCNVVLINLGSATLGNILLDGVDQGCQTGELWPGQSANCTATRHACFRSSQPDKQSLRQQFSQLM